MISDTFDILFSYQVFKIQCVFYIYNILKFEPPTFQVLSSHMGLEATVVDSIVLDN